MKSPVAQTLSAAVSTTVLAALLAAGAAHAAEEAAASAPAGHAAAAPAAFKADAAKGQAAATTCMACHTADGTRGVPANPILQGQHPDYIVKQLTEFKAATRKSAIMMGMALTLSDDDMKQVAAFYSSKKAKPGFAKNKATVALGEQLYRGGNGAKQIPACAGCHSPDGAGIPSQYPRVAGQHADYIETQLLNFRSGARANNAVMASIAARLNDGEIKALSDYMTGLR